jgi:hypothetical protein
VERAAKLDLGLQRAEHRWMVAGRPDSRMLHVRLRRGEPGATSAVGRGRRGPRRYAVFPPIDLPLLGEGAVMPGAFRSA